MLRFFIIVCAQKDLVFLPLCQKKKKNLSFLLPLTLSTTSETDILHTKVVFTYCMVTFCSRHFVSLQHLLLGELKDIWSTHRFVELLTNVMYTAWIVIEISRDFLESFHKKFVFLLQSTSRVVEAVQ